VLSGSIPVDEALYFSMMVIYIAHVIYEEFAQLFIRDVWWGLGVASLLLPIVLFLHDVNARKEVLKILPFAVMSNIIAYVFYIQFESYVDITSFTIAESFFMISRLITVIPTVYFLRPKIIRRIRGGMIG